MLYQIALSLIKHLPTKLINEIRKNEGDDISTYKELENLVANSNTKTAHKIKLQLQSKKILLKAESIIKECEKHGIEIASIYSDNYPELLKECPDKPNVIYTKGNINSNNQIILNKNFFNKPEEVVFRSLTEVIRIVGKKYYPARGKKIDKIIDQIKKNKFVKMTLGNCILKRVNSTILVSKEH